MASDPLAEHFRMLGRYNQIINARLYSSCGELDDREYRKDRLGSFRSIHRTLNHLLVGDRIWMSRFEGAEPASYRLGEILYDDFKGLWQARQAEDDRILSFLGGMDGEFLLREISYVNNQDVTLADRTPLLLAHFFNHQTHHRAQVQDMLGQIGKPPNLDLHRAIHPTAAG